ncbi:MAG: hypothetical protein ABGX04_07690 [Myxococcales bacterium]|nr:hypothetical protein [Myxococcales bacterium]HIK86016.1 hypothetical protein [Myxococcales bacterium]
MKIGIRAIALKHYLVSVVVFLLVGGLVAELAPVIWPLQTAELPLGFLSLSVEQNLPTWFSSILIFFCALLIAAISFAQDGHGAEHWRHWRGLACVFVYISLDEAVELHEELNLLLDTDGIFHFGWTIPFGVLVIALSIIYWRFLWQLPTKTRRRFILAGTLYVGGALGVELPLGYWTDLHGDENLTYALIDWVEESMEICGMSVFAWALANFLASGGQGVQIVGVSSEPNSSESF